VSGSMLKIHATMGAEGFVRVCAHVLVLAGVLHSSAAPRTDKCRGSTFKPGLARVPAQVHTCKRGVGLKVFNRCPGGLFSPLTHMRRYLVWRLMGAIVG
jgi:hypothetical protein